MPKPSRRRRCWLVMVITAALMVNACSGDGGTSVAPGELGGLVETAAAIAAPDGVDAAGIVVTLEVVDGGPATGFVITDYRGFAVYGALGETQDGLICVDDCLKSWVPLAPRAGTVGEHLDPALYGAINRSDGIAQATYGDIPLYTWTGDNHVGITAGAGVAGIWYALTEVGGFVAAASE